MDNRLAQAIQALAQTQQAQAGSQEIQNQLLYALVAKELGEDKIAALKDAAGTPSAVQLHGIGGLFSGQGVERDVVTAYVTPMGLGAQLPRYPTVYEDPRFSAITGFTATTGTRPTSKCADAPKGYMKTCELTAYFGLNRQDTQEIEFNKTMRKLSRGDHTDLRLAGEVLGNTGFRPAGMNQSQILQVVTMAEMVIAAVNLEREMAVDMWQGLVANGSFPGLDLQIATGQLDARTGTACPALDSDVKDFNFSMVDGTAKDIVNYLNQLEYYLRFNATRMRQMPATWAIVMRPELWYELSAVWPCRYLTNRCAVAAGTNPMVINDATNITLRDSMRNEGYIDIGGHQYPVLTDDGIYEYNNINNANLNPGEFASAIYMVPLTIRGGMPVTYMEYLDYRAGAPDIALLHGKEEFWTDDGMYSWGITDKKGWCYQLHLATEQRVVLRTPQLAGKIQRVAYTPLQHLRSPFADNAYFADGGISTGPAGTRYSAWLPVGGGR